MEENKIEYYLGYLRNPKQEITNGFQEVEEMEVILEHQYNDYREVALKAKMYPVQKNEVFDGHKVFKSQSTFIGRVGKQLSKKEAIDLMTKIRETTMDDYIGKLYKLIEDTREKTLQGEKEYQEEIEKFKNTIRK